MNPLVSVVIPSFNRPLLLKRRSIPSVLRQTHANWELIVVGDGPEHDSLRCVAESFGDRRIRYTEIPRPDYKAMSKLQLWHAAGAAARNHGVKEARGDIIAPLDDDDEFLPGHLADCVSALTRGSHDFAYGFVFVRDVETWKDTPEDWFSWTDPATRELFLRRNIIFLPSVAYSRRYAHLPYPTDGELPADYGLWLTMHASGAKFTSIDRPQALYYGDNLTSRIRVSVPSLPAVGELETRIARFGDHDGKRSNGTLCAELEEQVVARVGVSNVVCTSSRSVALRTAFEAFRLGRCNGRREVLLPSYAHASLLDAALLEGFEPVFCDVDPNTLCISPEVVESNLKRGTGVIAAFHAHGNPGNMPALERLSKSYGVALLSDAAEAFGASIGGRPIGAWGDMEIFSLSDAGTLAGHEGGLLCGRDEQLMALARSLNHEVTDKHVATEVSGLNGHLAERSAAVALSSLSRATAWLSRRRQAESMYRRGLSQVPFLQFPQPSLPGAVSSYNDAVLILKSAEQVRHVCQHLKIYRIESRPALRPLHMMPAYASIPRGDLPVTERLAECAIRIPLYNEIPDEVVALIIDALREILT